MIVHIHVLLVSTVFFKFSQLFLLLLKLVSLVGQLRLELFDLFELL